MGIPRPGGVSQETGNSWLCGAKENPSVDPLEKVLAMGKGNGQSSYNKNSGVQAFVVNKFILPDITEALELVRLPTPEPMVVADLGCSSGSNAIHQLHFIVEKLRASYSEAATEPPEFHAFFNDLPSNDFNNLFQLLNSDSRISSNCESRLFVCGVPGSFYGRLFPRCSVHVFFSAYSLHWLSKIPDAILEKGSPAYNEGKLWTNGSTLETGIAYKEQALADLKDFLNVRAAELVSGGLLFFLCNGRRNPEPNNPVGHACAANDAYQSLLDSLEDAWSDLISEGILTEEQRATINVPLYFRNIEDVQEAVESCRSDFHVHKVKLHEVSFNPCEIWPGASVSLKLVESVKCLFNAVVEAHLGKEMAEVYWNRVQLFVEKNVAPGQVGDPEDLCLRSWKIVVSLIRK